MDPAGIERQTSRLTPPAASSTSTIASCHWTCVNNHNPNDMPEAALRLECTGVNFNTRVC